MILKHADLKIPERKEENPFEKCKLGREKYASILTSIIETYADGFVLAINNEWGTGKTTFVKMWQQYLKNREFETLYFNAWENDYDSEPLVALLSELKKLTGDTDNKVFKSVLNNGLKLTKSLFPIILKAIAQKYIGVDGIKEAIGKISEDAVEVFQEEVEKYAAKKDDLIQFKKKLEEYIKKASKDKPVIFIIDELDRCRPDYAVEVLEQVKHFFSIPGIIFVLSIDKIQLGNAVKGFYGSEQLNVDEYLRRFIDIEYSIPKANALESCKYFYNYFRFNEFFETQVRQGYSQFQDDIDNFQKFAAIIFESANLTLRQQEKVFAHARLVLRLFEQQSNLFPQSFFLLIYIRQFESDLFRKIYSRQLTVQQFVNEIENKFLSFVKENNERMFINVVAKMIVLYFNYFRENNNFRNVLILEDESSQKSKLTIVSKFGEENYKELLLESVKRFSSDWDSGISLDTLLKKINLMENLIS